MIKFTSNINDVINSIAGKINDACLKGGVVYDTSLRAACSDTLEKIVVRIHTDGKASDGSSIGIYSKKPLYVNPKNSPRQFNGGNTGKTGKKVFESTGQPHATKYFEDGYLGFRKDIGRDTDHVNLEVNGTLKRSLQILPTADGYAIGFDNDECYKRSLALERKYDKPIWGLADSERVNFITVFQYGINNGISGNAN